MAQKMSQIEKLMFTKHLGLMLRSGISLGEAVDTMALQMKKESTRKIIEKIRSKISNGETMEKALSGFPSIFDALYRSIVAVGERSGSLDKSLDYLASNIGKSYEFKKKVNSAMMYPTIVLTAAAISGITVTLFVLPKLVEMFSSLDVELPISTKILMFIASVSKDFGWLILLGLIGMILGSIALLKIPNVRRNWQKFWLKFPWVGDLVTEIQVALVCRNLGVMVKSAIPLDEAIQITATSTDNLVFRRYLERWYKAVIAGKS